jgi:hypothetical protein
VNGPLSAARCQEACALGKVWIGAKAIVSWPVGEAMGALRHVANPVRPHRGVRCLGNRHDYRHCDQDYRTRNAHGEVLLTGDPVRDTLWEGLGRGAMTLRLTNNHPKAAKPHVEAYTRGARVRVEGG